MFFIVMGIGAAVIALMKGVEAAGKAAETQLFQNRARAQAAACGLGEKWTITDEILLPKNFDVFLDEVISIPATGNFKPETTDSLVRLKEVLAQRPTHRARLLQKEGENLIEAYRKAYDEFASSANATPEQQVARFSQMVAAAANMKGRVLWIQES